MTPYGRLVSRWMVTTSTPVKVSMAQKNPLYFKFWEVQTWNSVESMRMIDPSSGIDMAS